MTAAMDAHDPARLATAAEIAAADGVIGVPTLVVFDRILTADEAKVWRDDPRMRYVHPQMALSWRLTPPFDPATDQMLARYTRTLQDYTLALHEAGARIALGTDANNAYVLPGFSVHDELALLVGAGLSPIAALRAATVDAAAALDRPDIGTVEVGQRADLLILAADPTLDIAATQDRVGVLAGGRWFPEAQLQADLEALAAEYAGTDLAALPPPPGPLTCAHAPSSGPIPRP